tara:strand:+ start:4771 stop:5646 length:876 start_codon:yes stop_codon:yes gene_type:complete
MPNSIFIASLSLIFSSIFFVVNDAIINYLSVNQIEFYHFIFYGTPAYLIVPIYLFFKGTLKQNIRCTNYFIPIIRGIIFAPMPFITFVSLKHITLPEFTTLNMSSPFIASIYGFIFLKEKLNKYIYTSLILGFLGVLLVIQPGFDSFNKFFLVTLFGVILITTTTTIVNKYNNVTTAVGYFIYGGIIIHITSFMLFILDPLKINYTIFFLITVASILINLAIYLATLAFKTAQKHYSSVFCLVYLQIFWSSLIGFFIFDEILNTLALFGALFIILSGIISLPGQLKQIKSD